MAVFLIAAVQICPVFFLGTLGVLLLLSRPQTAREWFWIGLCALGLVAWFQLPESLAQHTVRSAGIFYVGAFAVFTLAGVRSLFTRALLALAVASLATVGWFALLHLRFQDLQNDFISQTWNGWRQLFATLPTAPPAVTGAALKPSSVDDRTWELATTLTTMATIYPALLGLTAMLGSWLSWHWYQRVVRRPLGPPAPRLGQFTFNDQVVWLLVAAIGGALIHGSAAWTIAADNVLLIMIAVYALRGLAVARIALRHASPIFLSVLAVIMLPMFPFAATGFTLLGVADTWLDFRRRLAPPSGALS